MYGQPGKQLQSHVRTMGRSPRDQSLNNNENEANPGDQDEQNLGNNEDDENEDGSEGSE